MIAAGKEELKQWFQEGAEEGHAYMLVVYDRMEYPDNSDAPYYAADAEKAWGILRGFEHDPMCEVMEVYNLTMDMEAQLAEKRAWHLPEPPEQASAPELFPAAETLAFGKTRLEFMRAKNADFIKKHFGKNTGAMAHPVQVFTDETQEYLHNVCVYYLEQSPLTAKTVAAVYRFAEQGQATSQDIVLMKEDKKSPKGFLFPLTQYHQVSVDEPYITFEVCYATGKDNSSPAYRQYSISQTKLFLDDSRGYGHDSGSGYPDEDRESHGLYQQAMELLKTGGTGQEVLDLLQRAAAEGHADAMFELGNCYSAGSTKNAEQAQYWYVRAACLGHAEAKARLSS